MNRQISQLTLKPTSLLSLKNTFVCLLIVVTASPAVAQHYAAKPKEEAPPRRDTAKVVDVREKLVQLALQNPSFEVADREVNKALYELRKAKTAWLGMVAAQINVNEISVTEPLVNHNPTAN